MTLSLTLKLWVTSSSLYLTHVTPVTMMSPDCHIESLFSVITYILETLELSDQKSLNKNIFLDNFKKHIDLIDRHKSNDAVSEGAAFDVKGNQEDCFPGVDEDKTNENSALKTGEVEQYFYFWQ